MKNKSYRGLLAISIASFFVISAILGTSISNGYNNSDLRMVQLQGNVPYMITNQNFSSDLLNLGPANGSIVLNLTIYLRLQNLPQLYYYAKILNDPSSKYYRDYLTPSEFRESYYPSSSTINSIKSYYQENGFHVWQYSFAPLVIIISGNISTIEQVFGITLYNYEWLPTSTVFISNNQNPWIPISFEPYILHIYGLSYSSYALLSSTENYIPKESLTNYEKASNPSGDPNTLTPPNLESFYSVNILHSFGFMGENETIGLLGFQASINMTSIHDFWAAYNIPFPEVTQINITPNGQNPYPEGFEDDLDVEWSGAMAPMAHLYHIVIPFNITGIGNNAVNLEIYYYLNVLDPNIISGSWGELQFHHDMGFAQIYEQMGLQAVTEGITIFLAAGDSHDINYLTVMASKYIVSVGGVDPVMNSTGQMIYQYGWYVPVSNWYGGYVGTGGGSSFFFSKPSYQISEQISVPNIYSTRGQPDISMPADHMITNVGGGWYLAGGTSYATPISAGIFASIESYLAKQFGDSNYSLGWIQPILYNLGYESYFGENAYYKVQYMEPGYWFNSDKYLGPGWNEFAGIGSLRVYNLSIDLYNYILHPSVISLLQSDLNNISSQLTYIKNELNALNASISLENGNIVQINSSLGKFYITLSAINASITNINGNVVTISTGLGEIKTNLTALGTRIITSSSGINSLINSSVKIETSLGNISGKIISVNGSVATIKTDYGTLQTNLSNIQITGKNTSSQTNFNELLLLIILILVIINIVTAIYSITAFKKIKNQKEK
mgnify:CR=1 FL=1